MAFVEARGDGLGIEKTIPGSLITLLAADCEGR